MNRFAPKLTVLTDRITPAAGDLDPTFGDNGVVTVTQLEPVDILLQEDGRVVLAGTTVSNPGNQDVRLVRLTSTGTPDLSFGTNGVVQVDVSRADSVSHVLQFPDGSGYVVVGTTLAVSPNGVEQQTVTVLVFTTDGRPNLRFGDAGRLSFPIGGVFSQTVAQARILTDRTIVLTGITSGMGTSQSSVTVIPATADGWGPPVTTGIDGDRARLNPDGSVITTTLRTEPDPNTPGSSIQTVTAQKFTRTPTGYMPDRTYGGTGELVVDRFSFIPFRGNPRVPSGTVGDDGFLQFDFVTLNPSGLRSFEDIRVFNYFGQPDNDFGTKGVSTVGPPPSNGNDRTADGRTYVIQNDPNVDPLLPTSTGKVVRRTATGSLDPTYGSNGAAALPFTLSQIDATSDGRIVGLSVTGVGGVITNRLVRLQGDAPMPAAIKQLPGTVAVSRPTGGVSVLGPRGLTTATYDAPTGTRIAQADLTGDGVAEIITGSGPGQITNVTVIDPTNPRTPLASFSPFEAAFRGGVYVTAGDLNGDGRPELVVTPDEGGGPRVDVYQFQTGTFRTIDSFFGIEDVNFRGGARAAVGDTNGDGRNDLLVAAGFGGGPRVAGFDGVTLGTAIRRKVFNDFFAFEQGLRNGVFLTAGDLDGDGKAEIIAGGGPGGGPRVTAFDQALRPMANFFAGDDSARDGVRLTAVNLDGDAKADLAVSSGRTVRFYRGSNLTRVDVRLDDGGIFVG